MAAAKLYAYPRIIDLIVMKCLCESKVMNL